MVLDEDVDALCGGAAQQVLVVGEMLDGGLGEKDVDAALDGVAGDGVVRGVGGEDGDGVAGAQGVNGGLVGIGVDGIVGGEGGEGGVETVVDTRDVAVEVGAWAGSQTDGRAGGGRAVRMAGNFLPLTPAMARWPTLARRRRSKRVRPTTPTFLSEPEAPPPTKPVVYSPVPIYAMVSRDAERLTGGGGDLP